MRVHYIYRRSNIGVPYNLNVLLGDLLTYSEEVEEPNLEGVDVVILDDDIDESLARGIPFGRYLTGDNKDSIGAIDTEIAATPPHRYKTDLLSGSILPLPITQMDPLTTKDRIVLYTPEDSDNGVLNELVDVGSDPTGGFRVVYVENSSYMDSRRSRLKSMIYIGDCVSGVVGHGELEALQFGCCVLSSGDHSNIMNLRRINKGILGGFPTVGCNWMDISDTIATLVENPDYLKHMADRSKYWMSRNYSESWQRKMWMSWILYLRSKGSQNSRR